MASNVRRALQFGKETVWGTPVVATAKLMGVRDATVRLQNNTEIVEELGNFGPSATALIMESHAEGSIDAYSSYEDILYPLNGLFSKVTPTGTSPYVWTFRPPTNTEPTPQIYTSEFGMIEGGYRIAGALFQSLTLAAEAGGLETMTADFIGKAMAAQVMTALAERPWEAVRASDTAVFMDTWAGTMGTTPLPGVLISYELAIEGGRHLKQFFGDINPSSYGENRWSGTLRLVMEFTAATKAIIDAALTATTQRQIELRSTSGAKSIKRQFAGTLVAGPLELFGDRDGNSTVEMVFQGTYNATFGDWLKIIVTNSVATLV